jgi:hypothetical protein
MTKAPGGGEAAGAHRSTAANRVSSARAGRTGTGFHWGVSWQVPTATTPRCSPRPWTVWTTWGRCPTTSPCTWTPATTRTRPALCATSAACTDASRTRARRRPSRPPHTTLRALVLAAGHSTARTVTWRQGTKTGPHNPRAKMRSRFVALRVRPANRDIPRAADGSLPECWLLAEWPPDATDYWLSTLPTDTPLRELVRIAKIRWRIEHDYRELKDGLGLDHFEGRTYLGWHRRRDPRRPRPGLLHPAAPRPKSPCAGLTLYAVLRELQKILATWTGACSICGQPTPTPEPHHRT